MPTSTSSIPTTAPSPGHDLPPPPPSLDPREPLPPTNTQTLLSSPNPRRPTSAQGVHTASSTGGARSRTGSRSRARTPDRVSGNGNKSPWGSRSNSPTRGRGDTLHPGHGQTSPSGLPLTNLDTLLEGVPTNPRFDVPPNTHPRSRDDTDDPLGLFERDVESTTVENSISRPGSRSMSPIPLSQLTATPNGGSGMASITHHPRPRHFSSSSSAQPSRAPSPNPNAMARSISGIGLGDPTSNMDESAIFERDIETPITLMGMTGTATPDVQGSGAGSGYKTPVKGGRSARGSFNNPHGNVFGSTSPTILMSTGTGMERAASTSSLGTSPRGLFPHHNHHLHPHDTSDARVPTVLDEAIEALQADGYIEVESPVPRWEGVFGLGGGEGDGHGGGSGLGGSRRGSQSQGQRLSRSPSPARGHAPGEQLMGAFSDFEGETGSRSRGLSPDDARDSGRTYFASTAGGGESTRAMAAGLGSSRAGSNEMIRSVSSPPLSPNQPGRNISSARMGLARPTILRRISSGPILPGGFPSNASGEAGEIDLTESGDGVDEEATQGSGMLASKTWRKRMEDWIGPKPGALLNLTNKNKGKYGTGDEDQNGVGDGDGGQVIDLDEGFGEDDVEVRSTDGMKPAGAMLSPSATSPGSSPPSLSPHNSFSNQHQLLFPSAHESASSPSSPTLAFGGATGSTTASTGKRRISFVSYNDMLQALPVRVNPLSDIVGGVLEPDHLPGTVGVGHINESRSRTDSVDSVGEERGPRGGVGHQPGGGGMTRGGDGRRARSPLNSFGSASASLAGQGIGSPLITGSVDGSRSRRTSLSPSPSPSLGGAGMARVGSGVGARDDESNGPLTFSDVGAFDTDADQVKVGQFKSLGSSGSGGGVGEEWSREGLGKGLEARLEDLVAMDKGGEV